MWPRLTRRRVIGACLLISGAVLLGYGTWYQSSSVSLLGIACWMAGLLGIGALMIQRINSVLHLCSASQAVLQQIDGSGRKAVWLLRKSLTEIEDLSNKANAQANDLERQASNLDGLRSHLTSDQLAAANWHQEYSEQVGAFRKQFGDFVGSVAEWLVLAETRANESVLELAQAGASAHEGVLKVLKQRLDTVDRVLSEVHRATDRMPASMAATDEQIGSISRGLEAISRAINTALNTPKTKDLETKLEDVQRRLGAINDAVVAVREASQRMSDTATADSEHIQAISQTVRTIVPAQRTELARMKIESVKEVEAILQLQTFLAPDKPMPLLGGWAMEPVSMLGVVNELVAREPQLVLECGSGTSTLWIAKALRHLGKGRVVSLEHLKDHYAATLRALVAADLDSLVDLHLAPLRTHRIGEDQFKWYDLRRVDLPDNSVDFLVIDGPPQATGPLARYPALPLLERLLADQALIILDDANRSAEIEEVARWFEEFPAFQELGELGERTKMFTFSSVKNKKSTARLRAL